jgi:hypothetical protein
MSMIFWGLKQYALGINDFLGEAYAKWYMEWLFNLRKKVQSVYKHSLVVFDGL